MRHIDYAPSIFKRWMIFNAVGALGIFVQISVLWLLVHWAEMQYLQATALAVETAIFHNFLWHERWTWADRTRGCHAGLVRRLLGFHIANGLVSLTGNLVLMKWLVEKQELHYLSANFLAVGVCAILNFLAGDRIVFRSAAMCSQKKGADMTEKSFSITAGIFFLIAGILMLPTTRAQAADLQPETLKAWNKAVEKTEQRISGELSSPDGFLALDFLDPQEAAHERQAVLSGRIPIRKIEASKTVDVPGGMIHHWRGAVFIPGVPLHFILSRVKNPNVEDTRQEDVLDSKVLQRSANELRLYLKLQRSKIVTVVYNTEHLVRYQQHGTDRESSSSTATKIAEVERISGSREHEKPEGHDRGFLWRMNSYWRYQQVKGGVIVECESMTLSRSIPFFLEYIVRPLIDSTARESMQRTLDSMRMRMARAYRLSSAQQAQSALPNLSK
jgi:putative flippase GtrA